MAQARLTHRIMLRDAVVCCRLCDPPCRVDIPARVFYRLRDEDRVSCPQGHQGSLLQYKQAAACIAVASGPFIRYDGYLAGGLGSGSGET